MDNIKDIISTVIGSMSSLQAESKGDIAAVWQRLCPGPGTRVVSLKEGTLTVHVDSAMRMVKINGKKEMFLEALQKHSATIERIHLKVAKV